MAKLKFQNTPPPLPPAIGVEGTNKQSSLKVMLKLWVLRLFYISSPHCGGMRPSTGCAVVLRPGTSPPFGGGLSHHECEAGVALLTGLLRGRNKKVL